MNLFAAAIVAVAVLLAVPQAARVDPLVFGTAWQRGTLWMVGLTVAVGTLVQVNLSLLLILVVVGCAAAAVHAFSRRRAHLVAERRRVRVLAACEGLAADLASGLAPVQALLTMADGWEELRPVAHAAQIGADVPTAFRKVAELSGAGLLRVAAAAWSVAHRSGAGLNTTVALAAEAVRAERATARVVATELAAARATARLLVLLPLGVLILGRGMGGDPFAFLLGSTTGQLCLIAGLGLAWCGSIWLERIADQVELA